MSTSGESKSKLLRSNTDLSADDKLQLLNDHLTLGDWNKLNGRFSSARKKTVKLKSWQGQKAHRHLVGCLALDPTMTDVWQELTHTVRGSQNLEKTDEWISWTKMLQEWSEEELTMHIHSGRISERECPDTPGVWEFKDNNKVKTTKVLGQGLDCLWLSIQLQ